MTLRTRLLAGFGLVVIVLVAVSGVITLTTRAELIDGVDDRLAQLSPDARYVDRVPPPLVRPGDESDAGAQPPTTADPDELPRRDEFRERVSDAYEGVVDADGELRTLFVPNVGDGHDAPPDLDATDLPEQGATVFTIGATDGTVTYRVRAVRVGEEVFITALPLDGVEATTRRLVLVEVAGSLAILAALGLVGWWMLRLGIRPIKEMTETASRIADGDLSERVPETAPGTEPGDLAIALNGMLGHIEDALGERAASEERLRRFVADASHELRTPVTTIRGYAELYRHGGLPSGDALDDAMRRTEQEAARMGRLVDDMLTLAKLDEQRPMHRVRLDLAALAADVVADARAIDPHRPIELVVDGDVPLIEGDDDRVRQVLGNVIGNALVHTDAGTEIAVAVTSTGDTVTVDVRDHGSGMPTEIVDRVTERFFRADPARARHRGGSGLGLAIVDAAVTAHGGSVEVSSEPGAGTTVSLTFPTA